MTLIIVLPFCYTATILDALNIYDLIRVLIYGDTTFSSLAPIRWYSFCLFILGYSRRFQKVVSRFSENNSTWVILLYLSNHVEYLGALSSLWDHFPIIVTNSHLLCAICLYSCTFSFPRHYSSSTVKNYADMTKFTLKHRHSRDETRKRAVGELKVVADEQEKELAEKLVSNPLLLKRG